MYVTMKYILIMFTKTYLFTSSLSYHSSYVLVTILYTTNVTLPLVISKVISPAVGSCSFLLPSAGWPLTCTSHSSHSWSEPWAQRANPASRGEPEPAISRMKLDNDSYGDLTTMINENLRFPWTVSSFHSCCWWRAWVPQTWGWRQRGCSPMS